MKILGILGGLGPMAGVYFAELVTKYTKALTDQEHMEFILLSVPKVPDRTGYIIGKTTEDPQPALIQGVKRLEAAGAGVIAIPCMTSHFFLPRLKDAVKVPIIDAIRETAGYLGREGVQKAGIMATTGTITTRLFQTAFGDQGIEPVVPAEQDQKQVMDIIYKEAKAGKKISRDKFLGVAEKLFKESATRVVLGCTELSLAKKEGFIPQEKAGYFVDVMDVMAKACIKECGYEVI